MLVQCVKLIPTNSALGARKLTIVASSIKNLTGRFTKKTVFQPFLNTMRILGEDVSQPRGILNRGKQFLRTKHSSVDQVERKCFSISFVSGVTDRSSQSRLTSAPHVGECLTKLGLSWRTKV